MWPRCRDLRNGVRTMRTQRFQKTIRPAFLLLLGALVGCGQTAGPGTSPGKPVVIVVLAAYPEATAEEVERQVTIPLEVTLAGMPRLESVRSVSRFGLSQIRLGFTRATCEQARQEVSNRLQSLAVPLPPGVTPQLAPLDQGNDVLRYLLRGPKDRSGKEVYTLSDLGALQEGSLERAFRRLPGVVDVRSAGGIVQRYEIHADPDRLKRYGVTLPLLQTVLANRYSKADGDTNPLQKAVRMKTASEAVAVLRGEEARRIREILDLVIASSAGKPPIRVEDLVEGGRVPLGKEGCQGVVVGQPPRHAKVLFSAAGGPEDEEVVEAVVLMRPGADPAETLRLVEKKIQELRADPGNLLPEVRFEPYGKRDTSGAADTAEASPIWAHAVFSVSTSPERVAEGTRLAREVVLAFPEARALVARIGSVDDGTDPVGVGTVEAMILLRPVQDWPVRPGSDRRRTRQDLMAALETELRWKLPGVTVDLTNQAHDPFAAAFESSSDVYVLKIVGPDLDTLEKLAERASKELQGIEGITDIRVDHVLAATHLEFRVDPAKCAKYGVRVADVNNLITQYLEFQRTTQRIEGAKTGAIVIRGPKHLRDSGESILDIPVDILSNTPVPGQGPGPTPRPTGSVPPSEKGSLADTTNPQSAQTPRLHLRDLVSPVGDDGTFLRPGVEVSYRELGRRLIPVRFKIRGRNEEATLAEAQKKLAPLFEAPYRAVWSSRP
jgi:Cu/Ag efflux pump CusA